jgi:putative heme-binding domain-containing protein
VLHLDGNDDSWVDSQITLGPSFTVETWVKLAPGIDNNDGILGAPGVLDLNFYDSHFRVWLGGGLNDVVIAKKAMAPESWTHIAVTRSPRGKIKIYINGELDAESAQAVTNQFENLRIGWSGPARGTEGDLSEFRVWSRERTADEIRMAFDRSLDEQSKPPELIYFFTGSNWGNLHGNANVAKTDDFPLLLTTAGASAQDAKFDKFRQLAGQPGDVAHGKQLFTVTCTICHSVAGQGAQIGPVLNRAGAMGTEALLRAILTPNAAMEAGYRAFRVELKGGDVLDGLLVSQDKEAIILRQPNREDQRILQEKVVRAGYTKTSIMPEGLLDAMPTPDVTDLFAYLKTLK